LLPVSSIANNISSLNLSSSPERLLPSSSPRSATTISTGSPVRAGLPRSLIKSFASLTLQQETVARVQFDHAPAFTRIFEKRSPTVPKAPTLHTEQRALVRSKSPIKMAKKKTANTNGTGNGGNSQPHRENRQLSPRTEREARNVLSYVTTRSLTRNTQPLTDKNGQQPDGHCGPPSSPLSDTEERRRDSISPRAADQHPQRDDLNRRREDEDDPSGGGSGAAEPSGYGGYYGAKGYSGSHDGQAGSGSSKSPNRTQSTTAGGSSKGTH
jgi:hypothetical protein